MGNFATDYRFRSVSVQNYHIEIADGRMNTTGDGRYITGFLNVTQPMDKIFVNVYGKCNIKNSKKFFLVSSTAIFNKK